MVSAVSCSVEVFARIPNPHLSQKVGGQVVCLLAQLTSIFTLGFLRVLSSEFLFSFERLLAGQHGASSQRQYDSCRTAFMLFLLVKEIHGINRETFAAFMRFLFLDSD